MKEMNEQIENDPGFPKMKTGYTVPEGYFDTFGDRLNLKMASTPVKKSSRPIMVYVRPAIGFAAGLAILLSVYLRMPDSSKTGVMVSVQNENFSGTNEQSDQLPSTYASLVTEGQFLSALSEMDDYDAANISKEGLADYLASNCSDLEILNANK